MQKHDRLKCMIEVLNHDFGPAMGVLAKKMYSHLPLEEQHSQIHRIACRLDTIENIHPEKLKDIRVIREIITDGKEVDTSYKVSRLLK